MIEFAVVLQQHYFMLQATKIFLKSCDTTCAFFSRLQRRIILYCKRQKNVARCPWALRYLNYIFSLQKLICFCILGAFSVHVFRYLEQYFAKLIKIINLYFNKIIVQTWWYSDFFTKSKVKIYVIKFTSKSPQNNKQFLQPLCL